MRRAWLRGRGNVHRRYLIHVAGFNLGLLMRALHGARTPKEACAERNALIFAYQVDDILLIAVVHGEIATIVWRVAPEGN